jgi:hypothetical protein
MMELRINTAKCLSIIATAALGIGLSPRALACGKKLDQSGVAAFGFSALLNEAQRSPSFAEDLPGLLPSDDEQAASTRHTSIVGMWILGFYHGDQQWDQAIEQFSADGNEMTNDNAYAPAGGNICWGVWEQVGNRKYKMKHIGWVWDANGVYFGKFDFVATITLTDNGDGFTGMYKADQEDSSGNVIPSMHDEGNLRATRFTVE